MAVLDVLAAAHAEAGQFDDAVRVAEQAIELAGQKNQEREASVVQRRLNLYRNGKPYRTPPRQ